MENAVVVSIPRIVNDQFQYVNASVKDGNWQTKDPLLYQVVRQVHLPTGHHADRDLELAQRVAKYLGGSVIGRG